MNQIGMNQMGINLMYMNQFGMNQMGMNIQFNPMNVVGMNNTTLNIKAIVQPYENKIKELEEIIRQKDYEITVLKQKLNNTNQRNNSTNLNVDQMMIGNNNQLLKNEDKEIELTIKSEVNELNIRCFESDIISSIYKKYNIKSGVLIFNYRDLIDDWSLAQNEIKYDSIIYLKTNICSLKFQNNKGNIYNLNFSDDCPIGIAIMNYIIRFEDPIYLLSLLNGKNYSKQISFIFNCLNLSVKDDTPIGVLFKNCPCPKIIVNLINYSYEK